ncbi:MAG: hypothetical protein E7E64_02405 [Clostridium celatum]|jgi:hypothetical protein|nr:hypothetical protein [Clostridium celatum]MDU4978575.1 hypothetical protein [Clostridium celatum]
MFNLFKRKNEMKELKCRVAVLEAQVTALNLEIVKESDFSKSWGEEFNLKGCTFESAKLHCKKCNKESSTIEAKISDLVATPAKVDELKVDTTGIWPNSEDVGVINYESVSPKANEITFKLSSLEGDETTVRINKEGMTFSVNKPELKEEFKGLDNYKISEK